MRSKPSIVIVTRQTRLAGLREKWVTAGQARFRLAAAHLQEGELRKAAAPAAKRAAAPAALEDALAEADFLAYEEEDAAYRRAIEQVHRELDLELPVRTLDRGYLPSFDFWNTAVVVVLGQDGLVANTAKYVGDLPIVAVNPDPRRFDGILLPFQVAQARRAVAHVLERRHRERKVTMAEVQINDGQRLLAFNDFFVGSASHVSARYTLEVGGRVEPQSSSGILVSTGAGSTGWLSSVFNMTAGVAALLGQSIANRVQLDWDDRRLVWAVREPFASKQSRAGLVAGLLDEGQELVVESLMPAGGVIFSDGVEADFLPFISGTIARIKASQQQAHLVIP
ncbi:MAG: NAD+ kinase [Planctomycetia bacterium]|nr:NAD+ kinase [Planctomycetia bacterium]